MPGPLCEPRGHPSTGPNCTQHSCVLVRPPMLQKRAKTPSSRRPRPRRAQPQRGVDMIDRRTGKAIKFTGDVAISPGRIKDWRASERCMRSRGRRCGDKKKGHTKKKLHDAMLEARVEAKREQAAAEEAARKEKARKRKAVLKKLRRRAKQGQQAKPATLAEIADLLGSKSSHLGDIAALLGVDAAGVEKCRGPRGKRSGRRRPAPPRSRSRSAGTSPLRSGRCSPGC